MNQVPSRVRIYTTSWCGYCTRAKFLLRRRDIAFEEIDLSRDNEALAKLKTATGWRTVPQIFIGDDFVGGADELAAMDRSGELARRLGNPG